MDTATGHLFERVRVNAEANEDEAGLLPSMPIPKLA